MLARWAGIVLVSSQWTPPSRWPDSAQGTEHCTELYEIRAALILYTPVYILAPLSGVCALYCSLALMSTPLGRSVYTFETIWRVI